jgi:hypothetical protein
LLSNLTIPVLNRYDLLQRMLDSIDYPIKNLLIIDNGGELDNLRNSDFVETLTILRMLSNLGVGTSWNLGVKNFYQLPVFYFASADMWFAKGDLEKLANASPNSITLHRSFPHWQTFAIGESVVEQIGLFDEALHPIYFEDNDYLRRAQEAGISVRYADLQGGHDNSSTIQSDNHYAKRNSATFIDNQSYYQNKIDKKDFSPGQWDLTRTRRNSWAK